MPDILHFLRQTKHRAFVLHDRARLWWRYRGHVALNDRRWARAEQRHPFVYSPGRYPHTFLAQSEPEPTETTSAPADLWAFWLGGELTAPRRASIEQLSLQHGLTLRLVTDADADEVCVAGYPFHPAYDDLTIVHRTDYLRAYVMHHHGGVYCDVKPFRHPLRPILDQVNTTPHLMAAAYRETTSEYVPELGYQLGEDLKRHYHAVMGVSGFICRPHSRFTAEWMRELTARMDYYADALRRADASRSTPYEQPDDYPIRWSELLGDIIQPLSLKYNGRVLFTDHMKPVRKNYR